MRIQPVRGKVLEKMLVKWAIEGKRKRSQQSSKNDLPKRPGPFPTADSHSSSGGSMAMANEETASAGRFRYAAETAIDKAAEAENVSTMRRVEAEEKAISLRDDKLLSMAQDPRAQQHSYHGVQATSAADEIAANPSGGDHFVRPLGSTHALTQENITRLVGSQDDHEASGSFSPQSGPARLQHSIAPSSVLGLKNEGAMLSDSSLVVQPDTSQSLATPLQSPSRNLPNHAARPKTKPGTPDAA